MFALQYSVYVYISVTSPSFRVFSIATSVSVCGMFLKQVAKSLKFNIQLCHWLKCQKNIKCYCHIWTCDIMRVMDPLFNNMHHVESLYMDQCVEAGDLKKSSWICLWVLLLYIYDSHTLCCGFQYETYIGISPYRTLGRFSTMYGRIMSCVIMSRVSWSCEKIETFFIFRAICDNTAHVQWIRCSPKGSHLIHWTSAVLSLIVLKWTPLAYLINPPQAGRVSEVSLRWVPQPTLWGISGTSQSIQYHHSPHTDKHGHCPI